MNAPAASAPPPDPITVPSSAATASPADGGGRAEVVVVVSDEASRAAPIAPILPDRDGRISLASFVLSEVGAEDAVRARRLLVDALTGSGLDKRWASLLFAAKAARGSIDAQPVDLRAWPHVAMHPWITRLRTEWLPRALSASEPHPALPVFPLPADPRPVPTAPWPAGFGAVEADPLHDADGRRGPMGRLWFALRSEHLSIEYGNVDAADPFVQRIAAPVDAEFVHHWAAVCVDRTAAAKAAFSLKDLADGFGWGDIRNDNQLLPCITAILMHPDAADGTVDTRDWWKSAGAGAYVPAICLRDMRRAAVVLARLRTSATPSASLVNAVRGIYSKMRIH